MKKLALLCLLAGCGSGFTEARVDGLATYSGVKNKLEGVEAKVSGEEKYGQSAEFIFMDSKVKNTLDELKTALVGGKSGEIVVSTTKVKYVDEQFLSGIRFFALQLITDLKKGFPDFDKFTRDNGFGDNAELVQMRQKLVEKLISLANGFKYMPNKDLEKTIHEVLEVRSQLANLAYKLKAVKDHQPPPPVQE